MIYLSLTVIGAFALTIYWWAYLVRHQHKQLDEIWEYLLDCRARGASPEHVARVHDLIDRACRTYKLLTAKEWHPPEGYIKEEQREGQQVEAP